MEYKIGDVVRLKKKHPCGSFEWEILRVGADFRLKCLGCGHQIMIARKLVEKNTKEIKKTKRSEEWKENSIKRYFLWSRARGANCDRWKKRLWKNDVNENFIRDSEAGSRNVGILWTKSFTEKRLFPKIMRICATGRSPDRRIICEG